MIGFCCGLIEFLSRESVLSRNALSDCVKGGGTDLGFRFLLINIALIMLLVIALLLNYLFCWSCVQVTLKLFSSNWVWEFD